VLLGVFLSPVTAQASFLSSLLGTPASASNEILIENSQNMALLQANVFSAPILKEKKTSKDTKEEVLALADNGNINIMSENALHPATSPASFIDGVDTVEAPLDEMSVYVVRKGESISQIAEMFGVSVNTILWANDMKKGAKLAEGDVLLILPVSGVKHIVTKGQTLKSIAKFYKVDVLTITGFNGITEDTKLVIGEELIIPDAEMPITPTPTTKPKTPVKVPQYANSSNTNGYYINPVPELKRKSQGFHGNNSVDLAAPTGTRILASADGKVILARTGYNGGYGTMVVIQHPNGTKTLYAHLSKLDTKSGENVSQGELIGYVGSTGRSTGPHLHFEVHGAKNPGIDWSWAR